MLYINTYRFGDGVDNLWLDHKIEPFSAFDEGIGNGTYGPFDTLPDLAMHLVNYCPMERQQIVPDIYDVATMMEFLDAHNRLLGRKVYVHIVHGHEDADGYSDGDLSISVQAEQPFYMVLHGVAVRDVRNKLDEERWPNG